MLLAIHQVTARTTLSKSTIYRLARVGKFPQPINLSPRRVGWRSADIDAYLAKAGV